MWKCIEKGEFQKSLFSFTISSDNVIHNPVKICKAFGGGSKRERGGERGNVSFWWWVTERQRER